MSSFKHLFLWGLLSLVYSLQGQITAIPDPIFEQFLVDKGFDSDQIINGQVFTDDINNITFLEINETPPVYAINDFTGIQDFASLELFRILFTNPTFIDFGDLENLRRVVGESNIQLTSVDLSGCVNLEDFIMNGPNLGTLLLPETNTLEIFSCTNAMLSHIDLSSYSQLSLINVRNNQLESLNVANGNNSNVTFFRSTGNPDLSCIIVDDIMYSEENWTFIDPTTEFCEENLTIEEVVINPVGIYPNPASNYFQTETGNQDIRSLQIIDLSGKIIKSFTQPQSMDKYPIEDISSGLYLVRIDTEGGSLFQKLIKE